MATERIGSGHSYARSFGVYMDYWGAGPLLIRYGKRQWFFEFSEMFGPTLLRAKDMEPADRQPTNEHDPFWYPFQSWMRAGRKVRAVKDKRGRVKFSVCHWNRKELLK